MARPQKSRKVCNPPKMMGYKPFGVSISEIDVVRLKYEEFESIRLLDYDKLSQEQAAEKMDVSRPTITRIYNRAKETIAKAFVEGKAIEIEGGNYEMEKDWYRCTRCYKLIQGIENHTKCKDCKFFGSNELINLNQI